MPPIESSGAELEPLTATRVSKSRILAPGDEVLEGRYRVESMLGVGGMGEVYSATQLALKRRVALKVLGTDMSHVPGMAERFQREALLMASIEHPGVVRAIDFGEWRGLPCLVMELIAGESLELIARDGPLEVHRARRLLLQLAEALCAIHAAGVIHRDLKLDNVLVTNTASGEQARLVDFGIARLFEQPDAGVTQAGMVLGTPEYMSPEQALGRAVDFRTDLYSWAIIAYRLLSGRLPLVGPTARDYVMQHVSSPPIPLEEAAPHLAGDALLPVIAMCLEKDPRDRPVSSLELVHLLSPSRPSAGGTTRFDDVVTTASRAVVAVTRTVSGRAQRLQRWQKHALGWTLVLAIAGFGWALRSNPERSAQRQLANGDARGALATLRSVRDERSADSFAWVLEARALHQLQRHEEEWQTLAALPDLARLKPADLSAVLEDFAHNEKSRPLREQLERIAVGHRDWFVADAFSPNVDVRWGAVRVLDGWAIEEDKVIDGYVEALDSENCTRRGLAARRLGELGDVRAVEPLERLKASPRRRTFVFDENCGQNEAAQALKRLAK